MLIELKIKNFRSFKEEQTFSLVASKDGTLRDNVFTVEIFGNKSLLRSAVIYGANASGKSNLINALSFIRFFVLESARRNPIITETDETRISIDPFLLDDETTTEPSEFELTFIHEETRYQYGFIVDSKLVREEWLIAYPKGSPQTWFSREYSNATDNYKWYLGSKLTGEKNRLKDITQTDMLFLSVCATFNHKQLLKVYEWFSKHLEIVYANESLDSLMRRTARQALENAVLSKKISKLLNIADLGITGFTYEEEDVTEENITSDTPEAIRLLLKSDEIGIKRYQMQMLHNAEKCSKKVVSFPHEDESIGTKRLFALSGSWFNALELGSVLAIDELDASLHPLLVRILINMFHDPTINRNNAQLIFNTHDTTLLDIDLFRRDQIWFVEKDQQGASHLYPLLDFSPRKDIVLEKGYLQGRYGAIPFIGNVHQGIFEHAE